MFDASVINAVRTRPTTVVFSIESGAGRTTSLLLTETSGQPATVTVRLYDPGNRSTPFAEGDITVGANGSVVIEDVFAALGLKSGPDDADQRLKNRVNVLATIVARSGGSVMAEAKITENASGATRAIVFQPVGSN